MRGEAYVVKKLGDEQVQEPFKGILVAVLTIKIQLFKKLLEDCVAGDVYHLDVVGNEPCAFYSVSFYIEKNIIALVFSGCVYLDEMILKRADKDKIALFQLVLSVFDDVCGISVNEIQKLVAVVYFGRMRG